jgi:hypothetical protein
MIRYRLLGEACKQLHIRHLLFAQHADDVYETTILRMAGGARFRLGLDSRLQSDIPENFGVYGVHRSGSPIDFGKQKERPAQVGVRGSEDGGVKISRPLLGFEKRQLVELCRESNIPWVEDESNHDVKVTLRNAVRHGFKDEVIPKALGKASILALARRVDDQYLDYLEKVEILFKMCNMRFDPAVGTLYIRTPFSLEDLNRLVESNDPQMLAALFIQRFLRIVSPNEDVPVTATYKLVSKLFPHSHAKADVEAASAHVETHPIAQVLIKRLSPQTWQARAPSLNLQTRTLDFRRDRPLSGLRPSTVSERMLFSGGKMPQHSYWSISRAPPGRYLLNDPIRHSVLQTLEPGIETFQSPYFFDSRFWIGFNNPAPFPLELRACTSKDWDRLRANAQAGMLTLLFGKGLGAHPAVYTTEDVKQNGETREYVLKNLEYYGLVNTRGLSPRAIKQLSQAILKRKGLLGVESQTVWNGVMPVIAVPEDSQGADVEPGSILALPTLGIRVLPGLPSSEGFPTVPVPWWEWMGKLKWIARYKQVDWGNRHGKRADWLERRLLIKGNSQERWAEIEQMDLDDDGRWR